MFAVIIKCLHTVCMWAFPARLTSVLLGNHFWKRMNKCLHELVLLDWMPDTMKIHYCKWKNDWTYVSGLTMSSLFIKNVALLVWG